MMLNAYSIKLLLLLLFQRKMVERFRFETPGLSHVLGPKVHSLLEVDIGTRFRHVSSRAGSRTFIISHNQGVKMTYAEAWEKASSLASSLLKLGLKEGERLGIWIPNRWEWIIAQMATALIGVVLVTINPAYRASEFHHAAKLVGLRALILQRSLKGSDYHKILREAGNVPTLEFIIEVGDSVQPGCISFNSLLQGGSGFEWAPRDPNEACNIQFTSGTTGHPKGSVLSHRNILNNGHSLGIRLGVSERDVLVCPLPLYHCFGCVLGVLCIMSHAATIVLSSESFNADAAIESISRYGGTLLYGVPTMMLEVHTAYMKTPSRYNISALRGGAMGGSPCPPALMRKMADDMNMRQIACVYGMTETSPVSFTTDLDDNMDMRCNTVGRVLDHVEAKIVDTVTRKVVPIGQVGEVCTKGYSVMLGYWNQPDKTKEAITSDGFMQTGDLGSIDAHGYCRIVGRSKDMIIRGGENIFPAEVENFLLKMPGVQDVSVIGVPDERMGEEVCAWIRPKAGQEFTVKQVHDFCKGKIGHYKIPRYIFNVAEFPLTVTGKVKKNEMRETTAGWLKQQQQQKAKL